LWALNRDTGEPRWSFATRRHFEELGRPDRAYTGIHGSPAFDEDNVYIGDYAGWLYAVDRRSGTLVWERQLGGSIGSSPVLDGERIWIAVEFPNPEGKVFAVRASDGAVVLASDYLGHQMHGTVSLSDQSARLVIGTNQGRVYGLLPESLAVAWTQLLDGAVKSTAAIVGDMALVTAWDGALHAFDLSSGQPRYSVGTQALSMSSPAVWDDTACFGSHDHSLTCVGLASGEIRWKAFTSGIVSSSPVIMKAPRLVIVGSVDGSIYAYGLDDGVVAWSWSLGTAITSVPVAVDRSLFVNDNLGTVWRLDASDE
jgi:outer membrane protein assembly factor BamB